jgi:hypothetical protein
MKKLLTYTLILVLILSLTGCNTSSLEEYKKAAEKTADIKSGQSSGELNMIMDFNTENMTAEEIKELNYYKDMKISFNSGYDHNLKKGIYRNYLSFGGLGFDFDFFMNEDEMFIKLPIIGKYLNLNDMEAYEEEYENADKIISDETLNKIAANWVGLMKDDDVFKGKDIVLTTPDGEVKTKEYTIKLNNEQIHKLYLDVLNEVSRDEEIKKFYSKIHENIEQIKDKPFDEIIFDMKENIINFEIESFSYTAYVDIDGYIVNEIIQLAININSDELIGIDYSFNFSNWNINKEQKFNFPELDENNTLNIDNMNSMFENIFQNIE